MKIGKKKLKMSSGEVRNFGSEEKRDNFERVAQAVNHGWKPTRNVKGCPEDHVRPAQPL